MGAATLKDPTLSEVWLWHSEEDRVAERRVLVGLYGTIRSHIYCGAWPCKALYV